MSLPLDNNAEPFKGSIPLNNIVPADFAAFVEGMVRRRNETHVIWFDVDCDEWATLPGHDHNARWDIAAKIVEPADAWHRRVA